MKLGTKVRWNYIAEVLVDPHELCAFSAKMEPFSEPFPKWRVMQLCDAGCHVLGFGIQDNRGNCKLLCISSMEVFEITSTCFSGFLFKMLGSRFIISLLKTTAYGTKVCIFPLTKKGTSDA